MRTALSPWLRWRALADSPWLLLALALAVLCYPLGVVFPWIGAAILALLCLGSPVTLGCAYAGLFLFDNMLPFPALGGSLVRLLQLGILLRGALFLLRARALPDRFAWIAALLTAATCGISFALKGLTGDSASFAISMLVMLALRAQLCAPVQADLAAAVRRMLRTYVASAVVAVLFGVLYNRFYVLDGGATIRFLGTHEPNFMGMFLDVALLIWLTLPQGFLVRGAPWMRCALDAAVLGMLLGGLLITGSLTGMGITGAMLVAVVWRTCRAGGEGGAWRGRLGQLLLRLLCGAMIAGLVAAGSLQLARMRPQLGRDLYAITESTGTVGADTPAYLAEYEYRALRAAGEPIAPHLLTTAEWKAYREAHGIAPVQFRLEDAEPPLQDGFAQAVRRIPVLGARLYTVLGYARLYGLDAATSGRWGLITEKLRDFAAIPLWQKLVGRGPDAETTYLPLMSTFSFSHNSYLDMLSGFGLLGMATLLWWFVRTVRRGRFFGRPVDPDVRAALTLARIALLLHAATLSMYLNRLFLFLFVG